MFCGASLQKLLPWQSLGVKLRKFIVGQVGFCKDFAKLQEINMIGAVSKCFLSYSLPPPGYSLYLRGRV